DSVKVSLSLFGDVRTTVSRPVLISSVDPQKKTGCDTVTVTDNAFNRVTLFGVARGSVSRPDGMKRGSDDS
ncbi:MAG: hypothetical protein NUV82_01005, partial [Candidatus Komeilibacteria bacterium]|nr:hypothetical protein [Candidatus Komeilibacteria bacterium]